MIQNENLNFKDRLILNIKEKFTHNKRHIPVVGGVGLITILLGNNLYQMYLSRVEDKKCKITKEVCEREYNFDKVDYFKKQTECLNNNMNSCFVLN